METAYNELIRRIEEDIEGKLMIWSVGGGMTDTGFIFLVRNKKVGIGSEAEEVFSFYVEKKYDEFITDLSRTYSRPIEKKGPYDSTIERFEPRAKAAKKRKERETAAVPVHPRPILVSSR